MSARIPAVAALLAVAACGRSESGPRPVDSNAGSYAVTIQPVPAAIPLNEPFDLRIVVVPKDGSPTTDLSLEVDARMPEHLHGMNRVPNISRLPDGAFKAEGLLCHMPGLWEFHIDIVRGPRTERAQIDVILK